MRKRLRKAAKTESRPREDIGGKAEYDSADTDFRDCSALYAQMEMSVGNAAKELRSKLVVGAECPVCGQRVGQLLADEHFQSVLEPVRVRKVNAEERLRKAATTLAVTQRRWRSKVGKSTERQRNWRRRERTMRRWWKSVDGMP